MLTVPDAKVVNLSLKASIYAAFRAFLFGKNIKKVYHVGACHPGLLSDSIDS